MIEEADDGLTLRRLLLEGGGDAEGGDLHEPAEAAGANGAIEGRLGLLPPGLRAAAREEILKVIAGVLDQRIADLLAAGWRKWDALGTAAHRSLETPGSREIVELADHEITSTHHPSVDVTFDGKHIAEIEATIELAAELHAVTAVVAGGRLTAVRSGRAELSASFAIEGVEVAKGTRQVELPIEIGLGPGIPLVERPEVVVLPPAPAGEPMPL
jgi:hypothetical protein